MKTPHTISHAITGDDGAIKCTPEDEVFSFSKNTEALKMAHAMSAAAALIPARFVSRPRDTAASG